MIIRLPYANFAVCAHVMSARDLSSLRGKILDLLMELSPGRRGHPSELKFGPTIHMWRGFEPALYRYLLAVDLEWERRNYPHNLDIPRTSEDFKRWRINEAAVSKPYKVPHWLGWEEMHASHRGVLLWRDYPWYHQFNWTDKKELTVIWPGTLPEPGEYLYKKSVVALVLEVLEDYVVCEWDGYEFMVNKLEVRRRVWQRAIRQM